MLRCLRRIERSGWAMSPGDRAPVATWYSSGWNRWKLRRSTRVRRDLRVDAQAASRRTARRSRHRRSRPDGADAGRRPSQSWPDSSQRRAPTGLPAGDPMVWRASWGNQRAMTPTPIRHSTPPETTANCGLIRVATTAASMSPRRGPLVTTRMWIDITRPRSSSGVSSWTRVERKTAENTSAAPATARKKSASGNDTVTSPNAVIARPQAMTAQRIARPVRRTDRPSPRRARRGRRRPRAPRPSARSPAGPVSNTSGRGPGRATSACRRSSR